MSISEISIIVSSIAVVSSIVSWFVVHSLSRKRDFENKKKEIRINYLINAWRIIEAASNREPSDWSYYSDFERAISDIQLFGTREQIEIAQKIAEEIAASLKSENLELLLKLRQDLRDELGLEAVDNKFRALRFVLPKKQGTK